ncbi:MAG: DNA gyrase inhibitor YacG, partial [Alphaproteobacteria bacterium]|nr:DNA gyrase inhibitor YacG [Alphaproteobacteria bacterium]
MTNRGEHDGRPGDGSRDAVRPPPQGLPACPVCGRPAISRQAPFCSLRCRHVDLHRWLSG